ncbi:MAG: VOC family protein [Pseudomonadota bacterium]
MANNKVNEQQPIAFHLAIPVNDIANTRDFYINQLGCRIGRESERWIDFDFFGHQLSAHVKPEETHLSQTNLVDGEQVPVRHFGLVLEWNRWHQFVDQLNAQDVNYLIKPTIRFHGKTGEQATFFIQDPSGNALEFKSFKLSGQLFAKEGN